MVLVLGGNGFIGYNLVKRLAVRERVKVFDRAWKHDKQNANIEFVAGDFRDMNFDKLLNGVDTVFHLISSSVPYDGTDGMIQDIEDNVLPTIRFVRAMKRKNIRKIF